MSVTLDPGFAFRDTAEEVRAFHPSVFGGDFTVADTVPVSGTGCSGS